MVGRVPQSSLGLAGQVSLLIAAASTSLFLVTWTSLTACRNAAVQAHVGSDLDYATMVRHGAILKNMTVRIETAERVLLRLLASRSKAGSSASPAERGGDPFLPVGSSQEDRKAEGDTDEEKASEEEQEREEKEQRTLIHYDEATKKFLRWRPDYMCGSRVPPLPDEEQVECNPKSDAPCCSSLGWCGKSKLHCKCPTCIDYRKENPAG
mmetsp:Transcript_32466/g.75442  ORF Transcript_32466/g.75442 Transcript_32466/m.75442 type:complete len:209 (+) Transcript_32466:78-704(+)